MAKLDGLETVLDFLKGLQPKIAAQIAKKVMSLNNEPLPADYKELAGYAGYYPCRFRRIPHCLPI